jgi:purine-binding chemotaxis protein CheW
MRPTHTPLLDQREALTSYLDSLFSNAPSGADADETPASTPTVEVATASQRAAAPILAVSETPDVPTAPVPCALVHVGDLRLAMPLVELHGIRRQQERLSRLPGSAEWVLGVCGSGGPRLEVVDTAALLGGRAGHAYDELHVVIVSPGRWALACDGIEKTVTVDPSSVRWRGQRQANGADPWFAGTVTDELCPYVDVPALIQWLESGARRR